MAPSRSSDAKEIALESTEVVAHVPSVVPRTADLHRAQAAVGGHKQVPLLLGEIHLAPSGGHRARVAGVRRLGRALGDDPDVGDAVLEVDLVLLVSTVRRPLDRERVHVRRQQHAAVRIDDVDGRGARRARRRGQGRERAVGAVRSVEGALRTARGGSGDAAAVALRRDEHAATVVLRRDEHAATVVAQGSAGAASAAGIAQGAPAVRAAPDQEGRAPAYRYKSSQVHRHVPLVGACCVAVVKRPSPGP